MFRHYKYQRILLCLLLVSLSFGFSWIEQGQKDSSNNQQDSNVTNLPQTDSVIATNQLSDKIRSSVIPNLQGAGEVDAEIEARKVTVVSPPNTRGYAAYKNAADAVKSAEMISSGIVEQAQSISQSNFAIFSSEVSKLQKQINNIIQVNDQFKALQEVQVKQIEMMTQQAREYKEIMLKLEEENIESTDLSKKDAAEILRQAQIRQKRQS